MIEYQTPEFRNRQTGQRVHVLFPEGVAYDVNYDGTVKVLAYLLNSECCVSIDKTRSFIKDVSQGEISLSCGLICNLSNTFYSETVMKLMSDAPARSTAPHP